LDGSKAHIFDWGSTGSMIRLNQLIFTLSSFPDVEKIEVLIDGVRGIESSHFNFSDAFDAVEMME
jgi:spore germination protein GerM